MSLAGVISHYRTVLSRFGEVVDFDISALDRLGIPVTSVSLAVDGRFRHHGNGYGATAEAAEVSGLGELAENVMSALDLADRQESARFGSYAEMVAAEGRDRVADPRTLGLPAGSPYDASMPLVWLPMTRRATGETVLVPEDFVGSGLGEVRGPQRLITPISNGRGAGLDDDQAFNHGLLELLQRHTNGLRFRTLDRRSPVIDLETVPPSVRALADRLAAQGIRPVLKHAATDLGVVSTYAMGVDPAPGAAIQVTAGGEAAHPSAEQSLTKALLEYANSRVRKTFFFGDRDAVRAVAPEAYWERLGPIGHGETRAYEEMVAWGSLPQEKLRDLTAPDESRTVAYTDIAVETPALEGHDVLVARKEVDGLVAVKVVVAGLEVETLSYGRIGELGVREALAGDLGLVRVQDKPSGTHTARVLLTPEAEERLGGPVWYSFARADEIVGPLYPLYREPPRHSVSL
ncbi:YcaO-like family protein [Actinoplanes sp. Pm04-4]|uniref:YcaO-like family protein n=1 Tax=Paractinoplanes pyxinae TaxID=2997416 RepID=A0ABT4AS55_9ACTN|nr:YcaO-like family protein [Actinoplanes pyxinae]MCY1136555.1 YcaO-like family protein [Actinoplanes pyxinae]